MAGGGGSDPTPTITPTATPTTSPSTTPSNSPTATPSTVPDDPNKLWAVEFEYGEHIDNGKISVYFKRKGNIENENNKYTLIDVNSDGRVDGISVVNDGNLNGLLLDTNNDGKYDAVTFADDGTPQVRLFDLNNDGKPDTAVLDKKKLLDTNGDGNADTIDIGGNDRIKYPLIDMEIDLNYDNQGDVSILYKEPSELPAIQMPTQTPGTTPTPGKTEKIDYTNDINRLKEDLNEFNEQLAKDKEQFESQKSAIIAKIQEEYTELTQKLENLNNQINEKNQKIAEVENTLATLTDKTQRSGYLLELQRAKSELALLESERYAVTSRIDNLSLEHNTLSELTKLDQEIKELEKQKNEIQGVIDGFEVELATYKVEATQNNEQQASDEKIQKGEEIASKKNDVTGRLIDQYQRLTTIQNDIAIKQGRQAQLIKDIESLLDTEFAELAKKVVETETKIQIYENTIALLYTYNVNGDLQGEYSGDDMLDAGHTQSPDIVDIVGGTEPRRRP